MVAVAPPAPVPVPTFYPDGGQCVPDTSVHLTLRGADGSYRILYTTDYSAPDPTALGAATRQYTSPIALRQLGAGEALIRAVCISDDGASQGAPVARAFHITHDPPSPKPSPAPEPAREPTPAETQRSPVSPVLSVPARFSSPPAAIGAARSPPATFSPPARPATDAASGRASVSPPPRQPSASPMPVPLARPNKQTGNYHSMSPPASFDLRASPLPVTPLSRPPRSPVLDARSGASSVGDDVVVCIDKRSLPSSSPAALPVTSPITAMSAGPQTPIDVHLDPHVPASPMLLAEALHDRDPSVSTPCHSSGNDITTDDSLTILDVVAPRALEPRVGPAVPKIPTQAVTKFGFSSRPPPADFDGRPAEGMRRAEAPVGAGAQAAPHASGHTQQTSSPPPRSGAGNDTDLDSRLLPPPPEHDVTNLDFISGIVGEAPAAPAAAATSNVAHTTANVNATATNGARRVHMSPADVNGRQPPGFADSLPDMRDVVPNTSMTAAPVDPSGFAMSCPTIDRVGELAEFPAAGEASYVCDRCGRSWSQEERMLKHRASCRGPTRPAKSRSPSRRVHWNVGSGVPPLNENDSILSQNSSHTLRSSQLKFATTASVGYQASRTSSLGFGTVCSGEAVVQPSRVDRDRDHPAAKFASPPASTHSSFNHSFNNSRISAGTGTVSHSMPNIKAPPRQDLSKPRGMMECPHCKRTMKAGVLDSHLKRCADEPSNKKRRAMEDTNRRRAWEAAEERRRASTSPQPRVPEVLQQPGHVHAHAHTRLKASTPTLQPTTAPPENAYARQSSHTVSPSCERELSDDRSSKALSAPSRQAPQRRTSSNNDSFGANSSAHTGGHALPTGGVASVRSLTHSPKRSVRTLPVSHTTRQPAATPTRTPQYLAAPRADTAGGRRGGTSPRDNESEQSLQRPIRPSQLLQGRRDAWKKARAQTASDQ